MLTGLSESLGCKIKPKEKISNNLIHSYCDIFNNLGHYDIYEIRDIDDFNFSKYTAIKNDIGI